MKWIFLTYEGFTFQPRSESDVPDIENMQVIGFSEGDDAKEAYENLIEENDYLINKTTFNEIIAYALHENCDQKKKWFYLDNERK